MSGYAKRMMEEAQEWLAVNPDPEDPVTHPPSEYDEYLHLEQLLEEVKRRFAHCLDRPDVAKMLEAGALAMADAPSHRECRRQEGGALNSMAQPLQMMFDVPWPGLIGPWMLRWARDGYNVFDLSPDFCAAMLLTDPAELRLESVNLPFRGILMMIPDRFAVGGDGGHFTKVHVCELQEVTSEHRGEEWVIKDASGPRLVDIKATDGSLWMITTVRADDLSSLGTAALEALPTAHLDSEADQHAMDTVRRIVLGTLAYLSSAEGALTRKEPTGKQRSGDAPGPKRWDVARTVRIDPRLVQAARAGSREVAFRLKHRHIVRGHYRQQPIGGGRKERKTIWIAPFWKGPADGAAIVHTYKPTAPEGP